MIINALESGELIVSELVSIRYFKQVYRSLCSQVNELRYTNCIVAEVIELVLTTLKLTQSSEIPIIKPIIVDAGLERWIQLKIAVGFQRSALLFLAAGLER